MVGNVEDIAADGLTGHVDIGSGDLCCCCQEETRNGGLAVKDPPQQMRQDDDCKDKGDDPDP